MDLRLSARLAGAGLLALSMAVASPASAQLASPGPLARAHSSVEGISNCTRCHQAGEQLSADKCYSCHGDVRDRARRGRGYHGRLAADVLAACETCHHDHEGLNASLIDWGGPIERFDHNRAGWPLRGKHANEKCESCHEPRRIADGQVIAKMKKSGLRSYLGVDSRCVACHFDEHRKQVGDDCKACHGEQSWKPAHFDHSRSSYPLAGKHQAVPCARCHAAESDESAPPAFPAPRARTFARFKPVTHGRCLDCHTDAHRGRFGQNCEGCHVVDGWSVIKTDSTDRRFHEKTRFPLRGLHANVPCAGCHKGGSGTLSGRLAHDRCTDCHADAHHGQLAQPACERCHSVEGFVPARFELEQHQQSRYPLVESHAAVSCDACHRRSQSAPPAPQGGKGRKQPTPPRPPGPTRGAAFSFRFGGPTERCETCHVDVHGGQLAHVQGGCSGCHQVASFHAVQFDHDRGARFALTGGHAKVACAGCHRAPREGAPVLYRPIDTGCATCHADAHAAQLGSECVRCHHTADWKPVGFSHDDKRFTDYPLEGQHREVACDRCHVRVEVAPGRTVARYRGLPRACEDCHADAHHGEFQGFEP